MIVVGFEDDEIVDGNITSQQERELQEGRFSGELCGGAVKARCVVCLAAAAFVIVDIYVRRIPRCCCCCCCGGVGAGCPDGGAALFTVVGVVVVDGAADTSAAAAALLLWVVLVVVVSVVLMVGLLRFYGW